MCNMFAQLGVMGGGIGGAGLVDGLCLSNDGMNHTDEYCASSVIRESIY